MSVQEQNPGLEGAEINIDDIPGLEEESGGKLRGILSKILYYHPLAFFTLATVLAMTAILVQPEKNQQKPLSPQELYDRSLYSLKLAMEEGSPIDKTEMEKHARNAYVNMNTLLSEQFSSINKNPQFINPFLIYGDACRLYADTIKLRRENRLKESTGAFRKALEWEDKKWDTEKGLQQKYDRQFSAQPDKFPDEKELQIRKNRRKQYIRYRQSEIELTRGNYLQAKTMVEKLLAEFRQEETTGKEAGNEALNNGFHITPSPKSVEYPPIDFELTEEDKTLLYYRLASINEHLGDPVKAERGYRTFLLKANRSEAMFKALMHLGDMYMKEGNRYSVIAGTASPESAQEALRHYESAADKYSQVITKSAPEKILHEAYFKGGIALLHMANLMEVGRDTWWDTFSNGGEELRAIFKKFAGREIPERTRHVPFALGKTVFRNGMGVPTPVDTPFSAMLGASLGMASYDRDTAKAKRDRLLTQARAYFTGVKSGSESSLSAAADVMIAHTLLAEGRRERARKKFRRVKDMYPNTEIQIAATVGEAKAYIQDNELDKAKIRLLGGREKDTPNELQPTDIANPAEFCAELYGQTTNKAPSPGKKIWATLPADIRAIVEKSALTKSFDKEHLPTLVRNLNNLLVRRDFYSPEEFKKLILSQYAQKMLEKDVHSLSLKELQWLNRMLLEAAFPQNITRTAKGTVFLPIPKASELPKQMLLDENGLASDLYRLSQLYMQRAANARESLIHNNSSSVSQPGLSKSELYFTRRRSLEDAAEINEFLLANYNPDRENMLMETASIYKELAEVIGRRPYLQKERSRKLTARAARTYLRVAHELRDSPREREALWQAVMNFYNADQFGRAAETAEEFLKKHASSDQGAQIQNILGRSYRNLGLYEKAAKAYRDNINKKVSESYKSGYFLGWVLREEGKRALNDGKIIDLLGDSTKPLPEMQGGVAVIDSALQSFNYVRNLPELSPVARPWRWATFDLGRVWFLIAEREKAKIEADPNAKPETYIGNYRQAEKYLRESLSRYLLRRSPSDPLGRSPLNDPEDYGEILCARFINEYYLARTQSLLGKQLKDDDRKRRAMTHMRNLINNNIYPDPMFDSTNPKPLYFAISESDLERWGMRNGVDYTFEGRQEILGHIDGPTYSPEMMKSIRRNAFFLLGQELITQAEKYIKSKDQEFGQNLLQQANAVYQTALDRLPPTDAPRIIYMQGETMKLMGLYDEALGKYRLAHSTWNNLQKSTKLENSPTGPEFWGKLALERINDLKEGY